MIPFEELAAALDHFAAQRRGEPVPAAPAGAARAAAPAQPPAMPAFSHSAAGTLGGGDTDVGMKPSKTNDPSNEIDIDDVVTDEEH